MRLGSLFTGYGGLCHLAAAPFFGARTVWTSDNDPGACKIIAHRFPGIPNMGDITAIDWSAVEPVDILTGGWPCQPFSHAGKRLGAADDRALWLEVARAVRDLRPRYVVLENVAAVTTAGELDRASASLASLGYVGSWCCVRAADVGAPHGRNRCFVVARYSGREPRSAELGEQSRERSCWPWQSSFVIAFDATSKGLQGSASRRIQHGVSRPRRREPSADTQRVGRAGWTGQLGQGWRAEPQDGCDTAADADQQGRQGSEPARRRDVPTRGAAPDTSRDGRDEGWPELAGIERGSDAAERGHAPVADPERLSSSGRGSARDMGSPAEGRRREAQQQRDRNAAHDRSATPADADRDGRERIGRQLAEQRDPDRCSGAGVAWGPYEPAIRHWERVLGRPAPAPTETGPRGSQRLAPIFVEHLMGLPEGWVTDVPGLSRSAQLKALGNGVVPQQCLAALGILAQMEAAA